MAHSLIESLYAGCTIRENWMPLSNPGGGSLNMYDPGDKRWHQTWQDNGNARVEFDGGLAGNRMVLLGFWAGVNGPGQDGLAWCSLLGQRTGRGPHASRARIGLVAHDLRAATAFDRC